MIILSASCSYIFIIDKSKKQNQSTKECWIIGIIVAIKIFLIKKDLLQPKSFLSKKFCFNQNFETRSRLRKDFYIMGHQFKMAQICPKRKLGFEIQKTNVGIRISILQIPCVPIFRQNG